MNQGIDYDLLAECLKAAMKVEYISNRGSLRCTPMLCTTLICGREKQNKRGPPNHQIDPLFSINSTNILLISKL